MVIPHLRGFAWQAAFAAFTLGYTNIETLKQYNATQADPHR